MNNPAPDTAKPASTAPNLGNPANRPANTPGTPNMPQKPTDKDAACTTGKNDGSCASDKPADMKKA